MNTRNKFSDLIVAIVCTATFFLTTVTSKAQNAACTQKLSQAQAAFDIGDLPGIPDLLLPCINSGGFSREENIRAHKLMTEVYLYLDELTNADLWMIELLKVDPEHKLDPTLDPQEIIIHKEKFRYKPIFRVSGSFGVNRSSYKLITNYGVGQVSDEATYTPGININGFLQIEKEFYSGLDIGMGVGVVSRNYSGEEELLWGAAPGGSDINDPVAVALGAGNLITYDESQTLLESPVFLKYTYYGDGDRKFNPYVFAGASFSYLMSASQSSTRRANLSDDSDGVQSSSTLPDPNLVDDQRRKIFSYYAFAGLGGKIRQKTNFIFFEVRYNHGLMNLVDGTGRYPLEITTDGNQQESFFNIGLVDDDFTLNGLLGVVGYQLSIYSPKKLKQEKLK